MWRLSESSDHSNCQDMIKFGGPGKKIQACKLHRCMDVDNHEDV